MITQQKIWLKMKKDEDKWFEIKDFNCFTKQDLNYLRNKLNKLVKKRYLFRKQIRTEDGLITVYKMK